MIATYSSTAVRLRRALELHARRAFSRAPQRWLLVGLLSIVVIAEGAVMLLLHFLPPLQPWQEGVLDGVLLAALLSPLLLWFVHRVAAQMKSRETDRLAARIATILAQSVDGIVVADAEGRVLTFNRGAEQIFGYASDEVLGQTVAMLLPEQFARRHEGHVPAFVNAGSDGRTMGERGMFSGRRKDGREIPVEISVATTDVAGEVTMIAIVRDVSERDRIETELRLAKDRAEAAARAKSEFLANMSHEIRTPMNAVIGFTDLLLDSRLDAEQRGFLESIRGSGDALLGVINDILDFSKIESGQLQLEHEPFDVRECVESALDLMAPRAAQKQLDLAQQVDDAVPRSLVGDVTRLRQVLANLVGNAVKFTESGEVFVEVRLAERTAAGVGLHVSVRDTGIGIPRDRQDRLFRSFSQADTSTTRRFGGTGLGLAICRRLVELMDGRIWVESEAGKGATFRFTVRLGESAASHRELPACDLADLEVLVVDDNPTNRRLLVHQLERWGARPRAFASAHETLQALAGARLPAVALLDLHMPEMDGVALAGEISSRLGVAAPPMILLSSVGASVPEPARGKFAAVLAKPIKAMQLFRTMSEVLGRGSEPKTPLESRLDQTMARQHPLRILLAEDNPVNTAVAKGMLARFGYRITAVGNGLEVLEAVRRADYDVILMDMQMPEMDGLEATRLLRTSEENAAHRAYVVALTANALREDRCACFAAGMDDFLAKPVRAADLQHVLLRATAAGRSVIPAGLAPA